VRLDQSQLSPGRGATQIVEGVSQLPVAPLNNDLRRSTALRQLAWIQSYKLLTEEEMAAFTAETRDVMQLLLG
jgi:hypothetical protein